ncbi:F-actin-monooxygenase Mical isoform X2 [Palaemon carinicauda]|uniref:F-actin-monooxygenase Mical isoform X2 n=1 Tax=Palaemon carinicauda TaxID=392227 RepID=UPI0035B6698E
MYNSAHHHHNKPVAAPSPESALAADVFEQLCTASTFKSVLHHYRHLCDVLKLKPTNIRHFYPKLKSKLRSWKAQALWGKFDKRASHKCYNHGKSCPNSKLLIIGAGPCGLRTAIEAQLLGAKVVVVEKRDRFSRNNVLHLWPFVINDLKQLGAKKFYGKFCAGAIDHISIRQLQCILLKVALLLGVEVIENVSFEELVEPPEDQTEKIGWRARLTPQDHPANNYEFDVLIGADGKRNTLPGFRRKEFRGKLAIAITANFINKRSEAEARVQEISGVAFIFNQKFFKELYAATGIDLENIVYYKDETHYFVMTAKKHSLIDKGVIIRDLQDTQQLLHPSNVDRNALLDYAREAADFSTSYQLPHLDFAVNHYGKPDVAMFDFTSMFAAENACRMIERRGHKLLAGLVGDSLLEPFWPTGSGCARGFLSSFDAAWMVRTFATEKATPLEVLAERESIYRLLAQTTPENLGKDHSSYTLEPVSRYPTINLRAVLPFQVRSLYDTDDLKHLEEITNPHLVSNDDFPKKRKRRDSFIHPDTLLVWCKKQVALYDSIHIENMTTSFKDGRVLCAIIHHYRPDLIDFGSLKAENVAENNQLAYDILEREFGVPPVMTGAEMAECDVPDKLSMISYVSQIFDVFRGEIPHYKYPKMDDGEMEVDKIAPSAPSSTPHFNILKNLTNKTANTPQGTLTSKKRQNERVIPKREDGLITCHVLEDAGVITGDRKTESLKKSKKRRSERVISPMEDEIESRQRREEILANRIERLRKQKEKRELDNVRFIRAMQMMQCGVNTPLAPSFSQSEDTGLTEYRKNCVRSMREKAQDLERKLFYCPETAGFGETIKPQVDSSADFNDKVKDLEAKFIGTSHHSSDKKPKDLIRRIGKIEKTDWNIAAIEKKLHENTHGADIHLEREKVPKWSKDVYEDKFHNIEKRLRENGEDEETIAKYKDIDASLKRLEMKLREGSTLETGMRGQNKVSNLASQLSSKLEKKETEKVLVTKPMRPTVPLPTSGSDLCHFCGNRVYLVERLSAEGKFFHRQCFKCDYCAANLRLGNYIYDRDGRYGGKFFCIPHYGLSPRERGLRRKTEDTDSAKENIVPTSTSTTPSSHLHVPGAASGEVGAGPVSGHSLGKGGTPVTLSPEDRARGTTPERVEFENSMVEQSDEEEYLSEEEWTDRNFGASANELDDSDGDDDSDFSDLSDEEAEDEAMEFIDRGGTLTAAETRRLAESWQRRYSTDHLDDDAGSAESDLDSDHYSEEYGAEGDDSHTATEGEGGEDDDDEEEEGEAVRRAREIRKMEVNIDVAAPPRKAETSDSGSETEVASDEESEESDTQIDTDSEFADDHVQPGPPKSIPTIVIDESQDPRQDGSFSPVLDVKNHQTNATTEANRQGEPRKDLVAQRINLGSKDKGTVDEDWGKESGEKSASLTNLNETGKVNPRAEQLKRLLQRTESTEAIAAKKALQLKRQYLLGEQTNLPRKSVSTADLGSRFKSFMDKISETQKMLNPAPQPSAAMQAFMNTSVTSPKSPTSSPSSPQLPTRSISLPQGDTSTSSTNGKDGSSSGASVIHREDTQDITTHIESSVFPVEAIDKVREESVKPIIHLKGFPVSKDISEAPSVVKETLQDKEVPISESSSTESSSTATSESDYDNVPSRKHSVVKKTPVAVDVRNENVANLNKCNQENGVTQSVTTSIVETCSFTDNSIRGQGKETSGEDPHVVNNCELSKCNKEIEYSDTGKTQTQQKGSFSLESELIDEFGLSVPGESEGVETINRELVNVNAPNSLDLMGVEYPVSFSKTHDVCKGGVLELGKQSDSNDDVDELFDKLASEAVNDDEKFAELVNSPRTIVDGNHSSISGEVNSTLSSEEKQFGKPPVLSKDTEKADDDIESKVHIVVEKANEIVSLENFNIDGHLFNRTNLDDCDNLEKRKLCKKDSISSPEAKENTELELSDWAGDNDGLSAGEDLEVIVNERDRMNTKKTPLKSIARIASEESLGDTDSAISTGPSKTTSVPSKPSVLADLEGIEYMDTSESASSPDEAPLKEQGYRKLEEETPTTPLAPQMSLIGFEKATIGEEVVRDNKSSESTSTEMDDDTSHSSVQEYLNNNIEGKESKVVQDKNMEEKKSCQEPKSMSEPPSLCENKPKMNGEQRRDSLDDYMSPKRYEGYIPRFKERMSPFGYVRDSLDVKRNSLKSPAYSPMQQDIDERKKNEEKLATSTLPNNGSENKFNVVSPNTAKKQIERSLKNKDREKEKDLIKEMVMSRISRKTPDKSARRGSRTSNSPLSSTSSRTSLFSPQSSQENLLDKIDTNEMVTKNLKVKDEETQKLAIPADKKVLLRLDSVHPDLPESGQTFTAEERRFKVKVGTIFRDDSVLGDDKDFCDDIMTKSLDSSWKSSLPESGETFNAEEGRAKVKIGTLFRDDSVLGHLGRSESLHDNSVPFADDSLDEEVFERKDSNKRIHLGVSSRNYIGRKTSDPKVNTKTSNEPQSPSRANLPATPMTHPEQFHNTSLKRELFQPSSNTVPITPVRRNRPSTSKGFATPSNVERPLSTPNLSTVDREKAREEARHRARLKTDLDLGLSPPNLADNLREKLKKSSVNETEGNLSRENINKESPIVIKQGDVPSLRKEEPKVKNKEERVKELLAEQREHRQREPPTRQEEWSSKDDRVRERLEEYRQKRRGSIKNSDSGESRPNSQLLRRPTHRPSLLELESLQVFTSSPTKTSSPVPSGSIPPYSVVSSSSSTSISTTVPHDKPVSAVSQSTPSVCPAASVSTIPGNQPSQEPKSAEKSSSEKKSGKKSKDRERRRSLIQVFAGMFSKSDDKKKSEQQAQETHDNTSSKACNQPTAPVSTTASETPKSVPKSPPTTVKDKLSRLRLSRSKDKKKVEKGRSNSADVLDHGGRGDETRSAFSLPTSPTRHPFSPLSSTSLTKASPPQASGTTYSSQVRHTTPRIEEESLSEDDGGSATGTPAGTLDRGTHAPWSGSTRKQKNALKIARQAELKRLRMAQEIQRQLEECEVKTRELEERGVAVEKALRGENGGGSRDEAELISDWFSMVHEKNALVRWEQELMVRAKELELEDRHVRLEHELRHRMALSEREKSREDIDREGTILAEMLNILEQKDALVTMLEEDRQRYMEEDRDLEAVMLRKGLQLSPLRRETGV